MNDEVYKNKVRACFLGKSIGGTLGMPFEGQPGPFDLSFYDPVPSEPIPNDDLDLQIVWATHLLSLDNPTITPAVLAGAWRDHVDMAFDEYAVCIRNLEYGIMPPLSGQYDNWFTSGMGAAIRSELWACLAPGDPERAAAFAYCDACCDHAGEGVWAEIFLAALQSLAFVKNDREELLNQALNYLPVESLIRRVTQDIRKWHASKVSWIDARTQIIDLYGKFNFTDVVQNVALTMLGWVYGEGDFGKSLCMAVNCGRDTDCTGATLGSLLGILNSENIPEKWLAPIGNAIVLSPGLRDMKLIPETVDDLTEMVVELRNRIGNYAYPWNGEVLPSKLPEDDDTQIRIPLRRKFVSRHDEVVDDDAAGTGITLPGHWNRFSKDEFDGEVMVFTGQLKIENPTPVRISVYGSTETRCWIDGELIIKWTGGEAYAPSSHRRYDDTYFDMSLSGGKHQIVVSISKPEAEDTELFILVSGSTTNKWLPWALATREDRI